MRSRKEENALTALPVRERERERERERVRKLATVTERDIVCVSYGETLFVSV